MCKISDFKFPNHDIVYNYPCPECGWLIHFVLRFKHTPSFNELMEEKDRVREEHLALHDKADKYDKMIEGMLKIFKKGRRGAIYRRTPRNKLW